ncbi:MAG: restriction endonuclease subunit [Sediminibacterium sp.]|nr:restriction endonuclease subunit [Sediminibacterium sp.]
MTRIEYPPFDFRIKKEQEKEWIFDEIRKQWVRLTPEEWVRQNMLQYLLQVKKYPASLIAIEKEISLGELRKRFDILIYRDAKPWMIIECKEMNASINLKTLEQILRYHITLPAKYLVITNGSYCFGFEKREGQFFEVDEMPVFE